MAPDQMSRAETLVPSQNPAVGARLSYQKKAALKLYVEKLNKQRTASEGRKSESEVVRDAMDSWFQSNWDELPEEARDMLDDDLVANAGGTE